jgi:hypothetical protein
MCGHFLLPSSITFVLVGILFLVDRGKNLTLRQPDYHANLHVLKVQLRTHTILSVLTAHKL